MPWSMDWISFVTGVAVGIGVMVTLRRDNRAPVVGSGNSLASPTPSLTLAPPVLAEVRALLRDRRKIEAIKLVREQAGCDLRTAKLYVESLSLA